MGTKQAKPVVDYSSLTIQKRELALLHRDFKILARSDSIHTGKVPRDTFIDQFLKPLFGSFGSVVLNRLFAVLDSNGNGSIEWQEYAVACYLFYYSDREDKMKLVFSLFDLEANGRVSKKEFKKISVTLMQKDEDPLLVKRLAPLIDMFAAFTMLNFDRHNESALRYNDWRRYAEDDDLILLMVSCMKKPQELNPKRSYEDKRVLSKDQKIILGTSAETSEIVSSSSNSSSLSSSGSSTVTTSLDSKSSPQTSKTVVEVSQLSSSLDLTQTPILVSTAHPLRIHLPGSRDVK